MTLSRRLWRSRSRGAGLFQVLLAIGVMGVLIVGAILLYQSVMASMARSDLVQLSRELRGGIERAWVGMGNYADLRAGGGGARGLRTLCGYGAVPSSAMTDPDNCAGTRFVTPLSRSTSGHEIGVWQYRRDNKKFYLGFKAIDGGACRALLGAYAGRTYNRSNFYGAATRPNVSDPDSFWNWQEDSRFTGSNGALAPYDIADVERLCAPMGGGPDSLHVFLAFR